MANTLITSQVIAKLAWALLREQSIMPNLVHRDFESDFTGGHGDTITVRKPASFVAKTFNPVSGIEIQSAAESSFTVTLDTILDVSFEVGTKELALNVTDFASQFIAPATTALVEGLEAKLLALRGDIVQSVPVAGGATWKDPRALVDARTILRRKKVPLTERYAVLGPTTAGEWLKDPIFSEADKRGDTEGLQEASIGRKFGFDTYESANIEGPTEESVVFHKSAFALVTRTLPLPQGSSNAAVFNADGFGVRVVRDYDISKKKDVISLDILCGAKTLDPNRAVIVQQPA